ncbi:MAG: cyclic nucleotide-binding domain-containing protein [Spirochaetales bacterium]|nr:cyclic nucleotide-binding domain-containing protein [Spirochaetales bacterium]
MQKGIITTKKVTGDIYFFNRNGKTVLHPSIGVEVFIMENFFGTTLREAIDSAKKYAAGALKARVSQKVRGHNCVTVVRNIRISYVIKSEFPKQGLYERILFYHVGDQILKKGDHGSEFFWVIDGLVDIDGVDYGPGSIFGRAAFSDGIRKMDVFAKTEVSLVAIERDHPNIDNKLEVIKMQFDEEKKKIKSARPKAKVETVLVNS